MRWLGWWCICCVSGRGAGNRIARWRPEELSHLEIIGSIIVMLNKGADMRSNIAAEARAKIVYERLMGRALDIRRRAPVNHCEILVTCKDLRSIATGCKCPKRSR